MMNYSTCDQFLSSAIYKFFKLQSVLKDSKDTNHKYSDGYKELFLGLKVYIIFFIDFVSMIYIIF